MVNQYLAAVRESGQAVNVVAPQPPVIDEQQPPAEDNLPLLDDLVLGPLVIDEQQPPAEDNLPLLDDLVRDVGLDEIDMAIPVFKDLETLSIPADYFPPPTRSWSRSETGGLRQRPPKSKVFDL